MQHWLDTMDRYGTISRVNHWLGAATVIAMIAIGLHLLGAIKHALNRDGALRRMWG